MPKAALIQTNFTSGELSPFMLGRVDVAKYQNGCAQLMNFLVRQQGGLWRRSGTHFVAEVKTSAKKTIVKEFVFSDSQEYVLEIGEFYVRFWLNGGFIETAPGSGIPLEVVTPYAEANLTSLRFTQSADIIYICHPGFQPQKLERLGANSFTIIPAYFADGPYLSSPLSGVLTVSNIIAVAKAVATADTFTPGGFATKPILGVVVNAGTGILTLNVTAHGLTSGDSVLIQGLLKYIGGGTHISANYPSGNGTYKVHTVDANHFSLNGSWGIYHPASGGATVYSYDVSGATMTSPSAAAFLEYRVNNQYLLANVLTAYTARTADVSVIPYVKQDVPDNVVLTYSGSGTKITADHSGVFTNDDVGKYVRLRSSGIWYQISAFTSDSVVVAGLGALGVLQPAAGVVKVSYDDSVIPADFSKMEYVATCVITSDTANTFATTDMGRNIRLNFGGSQPWGMITSYVDDKTVNAFLMAPIPIDPTNVDKLYDAGTTDLWRLGAWSDTTGWPTVVAFHEQRTVWANSTTEPQNLWMSQSADFQNMAPTNYDSVVTDACAITYTLASTKANPIYWLCDGPTLLIGTLGGEYQCKASTLTTAITPTNIMVVPQTLYGSLKTAIPYRIGYAYIFTQRSGWKMYELTYEFTLDSYVGKNLTIINEHILRRGGGVNVVSYQQEPSSQLWAALNDGTLACMTYDREQQVYGWHPHTITSGKVESICSVTSQDTSQHMLYMVVNRTIGGVTKRFIEYLNEDFYPLTPTDRTNMCFLDCSSVYSGAPATHITGLGYLNGEVLQAVADGAVLPGTFTPVAGAINLPKAASTVTVGYGFRSLMQSVPLEGGSPNGTAQGKIKRVSKLMLRLVNTLGISIGSDLNKLEPISFRNIPSDPMDSSPPLFTGDFVVNIPQEFNRTGQYYVVQDQPYPCVLLATVPDTGVYEV